MQNTPRGNRLHIAIFGRRNVGKSSVMNAIINQDMAVVSNMPGTTTDPVFKSMELLPLGPVVIIDTAGFDDDGEIGELRIKKTSEIMDKTNVALVVFTKENKNLELETEWINELIKRNIPVVGVVNKIDIFPGDVDNLSQEFNIPFVYISAKNKVNIEKLKETIIENSPIDYEKNTIAGDLINPKALVLLVAPQDLQAPKGRLILPQVQVIRDLLDNDAIVVTVKDTELEDSLKLMSKTPDLVITDSQVFKKVNSILPKEIPLTSFSILMARYKGDLKIMIKGAEVIDSLKAGDKILISEACTHHALKNDIAREKIPKLLSERIKNLHIDVASGNEFPQDLSSYTLVIHCGGCMLSSKQFMSRILFASNNNVAITNYGLAIAKLNGILDRAVEIFSWKYLIVGVNIKVINYKVWW